MTSMLLRRDPPNLEILAIPQQLKMDVCQHLWIEKRVNYPLLSFATASKTTPGQHLKTEIDERDFVAKTTYHGNLLADS